MKFFGLILIFAGGLLLAYKIYLSYTIRIKGLSQAIKDGELLRNEIVLKHTPLYEAFLTLKSSGVLKEFYDGIISALEEKESVQTAFEKGLSEVKGVFKREDEEIFYHFSELIGATDINGQIDAFENFKNLLLHNLKEAENFKKEKMKSECAAVVFGVLSLVIMII